MIAAWHLTWQDPVAITLAGASLAFVWWLRRRRRKDTATRVATSALRLSRRRGDSEAER